MNIMVRVIANQAQRQLAQVQGQITAVDKAGATAARRGLAQLNRSLDHKRMVAFGSQTQWTGRQLARNFTAPLLLAGAASVKFAMDNETAFNRVKKVYGDGSDAMNRMAETELPALRRAFEALSNQYGVQQKEVLGIAGDWAAAGASGLQLAKSVELTMKTMVLGEMEAGKATEALIAIQAQYGQDTEGLIKTINTLNMVENQTGISLSGLVDGMSRAAGVARSSGIDIRHLAAMMAALVPAAGSAANAGNALKTIISRVMSPTGEAAQVLEEMGIKLDKTSWKSKNAGQRLTFLANEYKKLGEGVSKNSKAFDENGNVIGENISAQQAVASTVLASRWQINRFDVLMRALTDSTDENAASQSYYHRALGATADDTRNAAQAQKELNTVLTSSPRRLKQMGVILQNSMANIIQPLIPSIIAFAATIAGLAQAFGNLNPWVQKFIMFVVAMLAILGPILIFFGSLVTAIGALVPIIKTAIAPLFLMGKSLLWLAKSPFKLAASAATIFFRVLFAGPVAILKVINGLKLMIAAMAMSGGVTGVLGRTMAGTWTFIRTTLMLNFVAMRIIFIGTLTQMLTFASGVFARNLMTSFSATFMALWQGVALSMTGMLTTMRVRMAGMVLTMSLGWAAMLTGARLQLARMVGAVAAGMVAMLAPVVTWGMRSVGLWTFVWNTMAAKFLAFRVYMMTTWAALLTKQTTLLAVATSRWIALHTVVGARIITLQIAFAARYAAVHTALAARIVAVHTAVTTWMATRYAALGAWLTLTWSATYARLVAIKAAFAAKWLAMSVLIHTRMLAVWAIGLARLRAMWLATVLMLTNPALLIAKVRGLLMVFASIPKFLAVVARAGAAALMSPWILAIGAVLLVFYAFRDQIKQLFSNFGDMASAVGAPWVQASRGIGMAWNNLVFHLVKVFNKLPEGVQNAFLAVVRIVKAAAKAVYDLFSYFNPFARHSPSLVDNVDQGMAHVSAAYRRTGRDTSGMLAKARRDLEAFRKVTAGMGTGEFDRERADVAKVRPAALPAFDTLVADLGPLRAAMSQAEAAVQAQEATVAKWEKQLDSANAALDAQQLKLDGLKDNLSDLQSAYDKANTSMQDFASAPIKGMGEYNDKIFENEMAQKKLRLAMMDWEDQNGDIEETRSRLAALAGDIETLQGDAQELRDAGAGSDVLAPITDQIAAMEAQAKATRTAVENSPMKQMEKEMADLQRAGERLDLERSIEFDPQIRAIEELANMQKELTYDEIVAGINRERAAMEALQPQIDAATKAVEAQETAVRAAEGARDSIQASYDAENAKLQQLKNSYDEIAQVVGDVEQALRDMGSAASEALQKGAEEYVSPGLQNFRDAAGGAFPDPGGNNLIGNRDPLVNETDLIDQFTKESGAKLEASMGKISLLEPFKNAWKKVEDWWGTYITPFFEPLGTIWDGVVGSIDWGQPFDKMFENDKVQGAADKLRVVWERIKDGLKGAWEGIKKVMDLFAPDVRRIVDQIVQFWEDLVAKVGPELAKFAPLLGPLLQAIKNWATIVGGYLLALAKVVMSVIGHTIGPIFDTLVGIISNAIQIIRGILQVLIGIFTLDFKMALDGLGNIFGGTFGLIGSIISGALDIIIGIVKGLVGGIVGFFKWLYDVLVGHSIVPDLIDKIFDVFGLLVDLAKWVYDNVLKPIVDFFDKHKETIAAVVLGIISVITLPIKGMIWIAKWVWDNILKPMFGFFDKHKTDIMNVVLAIIGFIVNPIKAIIWLAKWVWDNILSPMLGFFADGKAKIEAVAIALKVGVERAIQGLKSLASWVKTNVLEPIKAGWDWLWDTILRPLLNRMLRGFANIFNNIGGAISRGINVGISAVNKLIEALNWVGKSVPGLDFSISTIGKVTWTDWTPPQFAKGGVLPGSSVGEGFVTNQARAIVGEGGRHPEYVIPTDPRYRNNARRLYGKLGEAIGGWGWDVDVPSIGDIGQAIQDAGSTLRRGAVTAAVAPMLKGFDTLMKGMPEKPRPIKDMVMKAKNNAYNWMKGVDNKTPTTPPPGQLGNAVIPGAGWSAIENWVRANGNVARTITSTFRPGDDGHHGSGRAVDYSGPHANRGYGDKALRDIFNALLPAAGNLSELILAGAPFNIKDGRQVPGYAWGQPGTPGNHWNHVHAALADGGILNGPVFAAGEAGREIVSPLAPLWDRFDRLEMRLDEQLRPTEGDRIVNIYGNLEFPNITSGDDAEAFLTNLENVARK